MAGRLTPDERADRAILEISLQRRILYRAKKYGWKVAHAGPSMVGAEHMMRTVMSTGWPDLMLFREPRVMAWELKRQLGKTSPEQDEWLRLMNACGIPAVIIRPSHLRDKTVEKLLR